MAAMVHRLPIAESGKGPKKLILTIRQMAEMGLGEVERGPMTVTTVSFDIDTVSTIARTWRLLDTLPVGDRKFG